MPSVAVKPQKWHTYQETLCLLYMSNSKQALINDKGIQVHGTEVLSQCVYSQFDNLIMEVTR